MSRREMKKLAKSVLREMGGPHPPRIKSTYTIDGGRAIRVKLTNGIQCIVTVYAVAALAHELTEPELRAT